MIRSEYSLMRYVFVLHHQHRLTLATQLFGGLVPDMLVAFARLDMKDRIVNSPLKVFLLRPWSMVPPAIRVWGQL